MNWIRRLLIALAVIYLSWLGMQAIHEFGHVLAAWATGGNVVRVMLHPVAISRTDVSPNPRPLVVAWGGPLFGVLGPMALLAWSRWSRGPRSGWQE